MPFFPHDLYARLEDLDRPNWDSIYTALSSGTLFKTIESLVLFCKLNDSPCLPNLVSTSIMLGSVLPFSPDLADRVSEYCERHSEGTHSLLRTLTIVYQADS